MMDELKEKLVRGQRPLCILGQRPLYIGSDDCLASSWSGFGSPHSYSPRAYSKWSLSTDPEVSPKHSGCGPNQKKKKES